MNQTEAQEMAEALQALLADFARMHGLEPGAKHMRYSWGVGGFTIKSYEMKATLSDDVYRPGQMKPTLPEPVDFQRQARKIGLDPSCFALWFRQRGRNGDEVYRVTGINTRNHRYKVLAETQHGKNYKVDIRFVQSGRFLSQEESDTVQARRAERGLA